ncbi:hypothetical protein MKI84_11690 [Ancylobacter sp. A5.8]|uniref:hypothetical protein n=1 Tax=Ancylobacter gelatini TaxID=2919920 RepID=UPI001F4EC5BD|nr:hypothetical protein [Ancylobacter gelatini]MCJ8143578.1 hypothetical protein [Ancylobacter gelatini]
MPPVFVLAIGAIGAAALVKLLAKESRRVNQELDATRRDLDARAPEPSRTLRRDPATGDYRPLDH